MVVRRATIEDWQEDAEAAAAAAAATAVAVRNGPVNKEGWKKGVEGEHDDFTVVV